MLHPRGADQSTSRAAGEASFGSVHRRGRTLLRRPRIAARARPLMEPGPESRSFPSPDRTLPKNTPMTLDPCIHRANDSRPARSALPLRLAAALLLGVISSCAAQQGAPAAGEAAPHRTAPPVRPPPPPAPSAAASPEAASSEAPSDDTRPETIPEGIVDEKGCVLDPRAHGVQLILEHHASTVAERLGRAPEAADFGGKASCLSTESLPDVDGDGVDEVVVEEGCSWGTHAALQLLYFSNKGCPRFVGDLVDGPLTPLDTRNAGVRDLDATWANGCAGEDFAWTRYRWDGNAYRAIDRATCSFCIDAGSSSRAPGANRHPHCKAEARRRSSAAD